MASLGHNELTRPFDGSTLIKVPVCHFSMNNSAVNLFFIAQMGSVILESVTIYVSNIISNFIS